MAATQAMTGQGGWPMTVFMTPDGEPFYCGTYFPREQFVRLVNAVARAWQQDRGQVNDQAERIAAALAENASALSGLGAEAGDAQPGGSRPPRRWRAWRPASTAGTAASAGRRSSRRRWCSSSCSATTSAPARRRALAMAEAPARRWRAAASTTSSAAGSPGTAWTRTGWCRTSRRCSTTTRCSPGSYTHLWRLTGVRAGPPGRGRDL